LCADSSSGGYRFVSLRVGVPLNRDGLGAAPRHGHSSSASRRTAAPAAWASSPVKGAHPETGGAREEAQGRRGRRDTERPEARPQTRGGLVDLLGQGFETVLGGEARQGITGLLVVLVSSRASSPTDASSRRPGFVVG